MATYWKSVPRKFCDFCKCWITDNKPSVDYHERGKRHQENVKKRIEEVKQKSLEKAKKDEERDSDLKKMERAAMEAFKRDLEENPELKARYLAKQKAAKEALEPEKSKRKRDEVAAPKEEEPAMVDDEEGEGAREWYEAKSPEGYSYYWSSLTGASIWEAPESFISLEEQERLNQGETTPIDQNIEATKSRVSDIKEEEPDVPSPSAIPLPLEDIPLPSNANLPPEEIPLPEEKPPPKKRDDPQFVRRAYGTWETVSEKPPPVEIPEPTSVCEIPLPEPPPAKPKERFKEKKVTSLGGGGASVGFKKRKLASGARNVRQRDGDA